jgi:hypothetical protein
MSALRHSILIATTAAAAAAITATSLSGCGDDSVKIVCPEVDLYDARDAADRDRVDDQLREAADAGCLTYPVPPQGAAGSNP